MEEIDTMADNLREDIEAEVRNRIGDKLRNRQRVRARGCRGFGSPRSRLIYSIFLIVAGVFLFLDNIGVLVVNNIWAYSPLMLSLWGGIILTEGRSVWRRYWGGVLVVLGAVGLLFNLGLVHLHTRDDSWFLALLLIAFGGATLVKTLARDPVDDSGPGWSETSTSNISLFDEHAVFGSVKRRVDSIDFRGGEIHCVFGGYELDLRNAQIASGRPPEVEVHCVFGSVKVFIPANWSVVLRAAGVFGSVEDKTVPPRTAGGLVNPVLVITGASVFASVEIEN